MTLTSTVFVIDEDEPDGGISAGLLAHAEFRLRTYARLAEFRSEYNPTTPGCVVVSVRRNNGKSFEQLMRGGVRLPIIVISHVANVSMAVDAMKAGAFDFFGVPIDRSRLIRRLHDAIAFDEQQRVADSDFAELAQRMERLTERELHTLELIRAGGTNKAIAARMQITERAVEMRRSSIMRKLNVRSVAELIDVVATFRVLKRERGRAEARGRGSD